MVHLQTSKPSAINQKDSMETRDKEKRPEMCSGCSGTVQKRSRTMVGTLPDDVVLEILSMLPINYVLKFQSVCQRWKDLISTQMHLMKTCGPTMILVGRRKKLLHKSCSPPMILREKSELLQLDNSGAAPKIIAMRKVWPRLPSSFAFILSYDGLIAVYKFPNYTIRNPITRDKVTIKHVRSGFGMCGIFFNTLIKEYCALWGSFQKGKIQFKLLTLGAQPHFRDLKQPTFYTRKPRYPPVIIDDDATMYWLLRPRGVDELIAFRGQFSLCEKQIMAFDIKTEEFTLMPHPGSRDDCHRSKHLNMHIFKMGGRLSFVQMTINGLLILNIWTLNDSASRLWIKTHSNVTIDMSKYIWLKMEESIGVVGVEKEELLLYIRKDDSVLGSDHTFQGIYAYNLVLTTLRMIHCNYWTRERTHNMPIYVPSFVSLPNHKIRFPYS